MTTPPSSINNTATAVNTGIARLNGGIVTIAEAIAIADQPWLGNVFIKWIWEAVFEWIAGCFSKAEQTGATFLIIDSQTGAEVKGLGKEVLAVIAARNTGDPAKIKEAIQAFADAQSALTHDDGSAKPQ